MKPETLSLLRAPGSHERLRLETRSGPDRAIQESLVGVDSGQIFPIRDGIPLLLDQSLVSGANARYQRGYDRAAGVYDAAMAMFGLLAGGSEARFRGEYLQELELAEGGRLLEVSIGTGANVRYLPVRGGVYGLDLSWGMLRRCRRNLARWRRDAELIMGNAEDLPLADASFDAVLHVGGINAFNDRALALREMVRVARPGSKIVIVDETDKMMRPFAWVPAVRRVLDEFGDRFSAPVEHLPEGLAEVAVRPVARGNLYCLSFRVD